MKLFKFRFVRDSYAGYEVQIWRFWFPFWSQVGIVNTHRTIEDAEQFMRQHYLYYDEKTFFLTIF